MANKYIALNPDGTKAEVEGQVTSAGAGDAGKIPALDAGGKIDSSLLPTGVGDEIESIEAGEALTGGDWVNIYDDAGTRKVQKADATGGAVKKCHGFVLAGVSLAQTASVYVQGTNTGADGVAAADVGSPAYLSKTAGGDTDDVSAYVSTDFVQYLGEYVGVNAVAFDPDQGITKA